MLVPNQEEEIKPFTWADLKEFANGLTDEQLKQEVIVPQDEGYIKILYASELGEDQYNFSDAEYSTTASEFDPDMFDKEGITFSEALEIEEYTVTPGSNVYLFDE